MNRNNNVNIQSNTQALSQQQAQKLSHEQQQSLQILQVMREDLSQLLMDLALENPLMIVEDTRNMLTIDPQEGILSLSTDSIHQSEPDYIIPTPYDQDDSHQAMINQLQDDSRSTLQTYLIDQIMCYRHTRLRDLMIRLIDELDEQGFLSQAPEVLEQKLACTYIELLDAMTLIQQLEPIGVGSRNLREYWMLQTENDPAAPNIAYIILESYFGQLTSREFHIIAEALAVSLEEVEDAVAYYYNLSSAPMDHFSGEETVYVEPDVFVQRSWDGKYEVSYNLRNLPRVSLDRAYLKELLAVDNNEELQTYVKTKQQEVKAVLMSLKRREQTLIQVSQALIDAQIQFFQSKGQLLAPLTLAQIATTCKISPSTVSRTIQDKYFYTDFGVFELKTLLNTAAIQNEAGDSISQHNILQKIQTLVNQEDKRQPLSDQQLTDLLNEEGIPLARRTLAKYRQQLEILPARQRKIK